MSLSMHYLSVPAPAKSLWGMFPQWEQGDSVEIQGLAKYQPVFQYPAVLLHQSNCLSLPGKTLTEYHLKEIKKIVTTA